MANPSGSFIWYELMTTDPDGAAAFYGPVVGWRISAKAVAGVTLFATIFWLVEVLNEVIGVSSIALITQSFGSGDQERTARVVEQTVVFKVFVAIISAVFVFILAIYREIKKDEC